MKFIFNKSFIKWLVLAALIVTAITLGLVFGLRDKPNARILGAVASNGVISVEEDRGCAHIGQEMLYEGGSAVDAAIAVLLCEGVMLPHSMGIGGGFVATVYTKASQKIETIIAREAAPAAATQDMFVGKNVTGALAAAVPGEIMGYWELHKKYGRLPWKTLFEPTIKLCEGHRVSKYLASALDRRQEYIFNEPSMHVFLNDKGELFKENDTMIRRQLGETLRKIADSDAGVMYDGGEVGQQLIDDLNQMGGIMTLDDLKNYRVRWETENHVKANIVGGHTLYTTPLPSSGALLAFIMNILNDFYTSDRKIYWQRVIESYKHAYGLRSRLGDAKMEDDNMMKARIEETFQNLVSPSFAKSIHAKIHDDATVEDVSYYGADYTIEPDHGTANVAILAPNGDAIVVTSTINNYFGSKVRSSQTGIIFNDEMDDFSTPGTVNSFGVPASPSNYIKPGKMPMSSMCPAIILDQNGNVRMLIGGAGGTKITTSIVDSIIKYMIFGESMEDSINTGRMHHQLAPMLLETEADVPAEIRDYLTNIVKHSASVPSTSDFAALTAIGVRDNIPVPKYDKRRVGTVAVVEDRNKIRH